MKIKSAIKIRIWNFVYKEKLKPKIFGIGFNKTGTTSLWQAMLDFNYKAAPQGPAELLIRDYAKRDFRALTEFCKQHDFFQDIPFSYPFTFIAMDQIFPNSKFILTVRDSGEQWYNSLVNFHAKTFGKGKIPTAQVLKEAAYHYKGFPWEARSIAFNITEEDPYPKEKLIAIYENHNQAVKDYFRYRPNDLLVINTADPDSYLKLCSFLNKKPLYEKMPWENKT